MWYQRESYSVAALHISQVSGYWILWLDPCAFSGFAVSLLVYLCYFIVGLTTLKSILALGALKFV